MSEAVFFVDSAQNLSTMPVMDQVAEKVSRLPHSPGVYIMKGENDVWLYIGKAKDLRRRVASYFREGGDDRYQIRFLVKQIRDLECVVTDTEKEALLLEHTLIQRHQPKYNVFLKDGKTFSRIRIGTDHPFPRIGIVRRVAKDGARYFGPYLSGGVARETVDRVVRLFQLRTCSDREFANRSRPCVEHQIGRCTAPCVKLVSSHHYEEQVRQAIQFVSGRHREIMNEMKIAMAKASNDLQFEEAARLRDAIADIKASCEMQKVMSHRLHDQDVVGWIEESGDVGIQFFSIRDGKLSSSQHFIVKVTEDPMDTVVSCMMQYYHDAGRIPREVIVASGLEQGDTLSQILSERSGKSVTIKVPRRGERFRLVEMAVANARQALELANGKRLQALDLAAALAKELQLPAPPRRIECVDISNLSGKSPYGAMVTFVDGVPEKSGYRLFRIQSAHEPDDYRMMAETLRRRFRRSDWTKPDLLVVDGGKGQLGVAVRALDEVGAMDIPIVAIAKGRQEGEEDKLYLPNRKNPVIFRKGDPLIIFVKRIRDEVHRFGITAHRRGRLKEAGV